MKGFDDMARRHHTDWNEGITDEQNGDVDLKLNAFLLNICISLAETLFGLRIERRTISYDRLPTILFLAQDIG